MELGKHLGGCLEWAGFQNPASLLWEVCGVTVLWCLDSYQAALEQFPPWPTIGPDSVLCRPDAGDLGCGGWGLSDATRSGVCETPAFHGVLGVGHMSSPFECTLGSEGCS